jgi:hypothetical protein
VDLRTGKSPPMHTKAPSLWHGDPTLRNSHKERATVVRLYALPSSPQPAVKKANCRTRNVQPPCSYTPFHLRRNQRSRRRTAAQGACNRPAVACPLSFAATGGSTSSMGGPGPHVIHPAHRFLGTGKSHRRSRQYRASSRPSQKTKKINFQKPMQRLEAPRAWPNKGIKYEGHMPVSHGGRRGSRRDHRRAGSNCINGRAGAESQSPVKLWPHLQARILP